MKSVTKSPKHGWRGIWFVLPLVALWLIPAVLFTVAFPVANSKEREALTTPAPQTTVIGSAKQDYRRAVSISVARSEGLAVHSPVTGVVNSVQVSTGESLRTGTQLMTVGGAPVFAIIDRAPLYRELGLEDTGEDVETMCSVLRTVGVVVPYSCTTVTEDVESAIKSFAKKFNLASTGRFRSDYTVYIPAGVGKVGKVAVARGTQVDTTSAIFTMGSRVKGVKITSADDSGKLSDLKGAPITLTLGTKTFDLKSLKVKKSERSALARLLAKQGKAGELQVVDEGTSGVITYSGGIAKLGVPSILGAVPGSAIFPTASGTMCAFAPGIESSKRPSPIAVKSVDELFSPAGGGSGRGCFAGRNHGNHRCFYVAVGRGQPMRVIVEDARVRFGDNVVLDGFSATFEPDTVTALVGPSGSGKSTLLAAIAGYEDLQGGEIWVEEGDHRATPDPSQMAWVPQGNNALSARIALDNVMIGPMAAGASLVQARQTALEALAAVGLKNKAYEPIRILSGGELQRVGFARAIASGRPLILADEPSSSLDAANTETIANLLTRLANRATIIVATHDPILVDAAQAVINLREHHG